MALHPRQLLCTAEMHDIETHVGSTAFIQHTTARIRRRANWNKQPTDHKIAYSHPSSALFKLHRLGGALHLRGLFAFCQGTWDETRCR